MCSAMLLAFDQLDQHFDGCREMSLLILTDGMPQEAWNPCRYNVLERGEPEGIWTDTLYNTYDRLQNFGGVSIFVTLFKLYLIVLSEDESFCFSEFLGLSVSSKDFINLILLITSYNLKQILETTVFLGF